MATMNVAVMDSTQQENQFMPEAKSKITIVP